MVFKNYDEKFKKNIVYLFETGYSVEFISKEHKVSEATIYSWIRKYSLNDKGLEAVNILKENIKLKKELEVLKQALTIIATK